MGRNQFEFSIPKRDDDEPDLSDKQLSFIAHLLDETDVRGLTIDDARRLGKWQASAMIDRLIEIRDGADQSSAKVKIRSSIWTRKFSIWWLFALVLFLAYVMGD